MKKKLCYIFLLFLLIEANLTFAAPLQPTATKPAANNPISNNSHTRVTLDLLPDRPIMLNEKDNTFANQIEILFREYKYFYDKFPGDTIDGDIYPAIIERYPHITYSEMVEKAKTIRQNIKAYRWAMKIYDDIKAKLLVPDAPPLIIDKEDYDYPQEYEYIDSDEPHIINDFKKVISYSMNKRDFEAVESYLRRKKKQDLAQSGFEKIGGLFEKLELKKLFFYGVAYDDPFSGKQGIGPWQSSNQASVRLISEAINLNTNHIRAAIHVKLNPGQMLLWSPEKNIAEPEFDFSASHNLQQAKVLMPLPIRVSTKDYDNIMGYIGDFAIPVELTVKNISEDLDVQLQFQAQICGNNQCSLQKFSVPLLLSAGHSQLKSSLANFINKTYNALPQSHINEMQIVKSVVDDNPKLSTKTLRIVLKSDGTPPKFNIFLKSYQGENFDRPKITIDNDYITARFVVRDYEQDLVGHRFDITASYSYSRSFHQSIIAEPASILDSNRGDLSFGLLLMAFIGGFILNFMPCVFPVLSLKILSLTKIGALRTNQIRQSFAYTVIGVFGAFAMLILLLLLLKYTGHAIGWGMQFQNPYFLVSIVFVMLLFMAQIFDIITIKTPQFLLNFLNNKDHSDNFINILTGLFLVLVSTPCTAPYLGTALGFALAGSYTDIIFIMSAVCVGLSLPYLMLSIIPSLGLLMPKPGMWMKKINSFMIIMLFSTIVWLLSILYAQSSFSSVVTIIVCGIVFILLLILRRQTIQNIDAQSEISEVKNLATVFIKQSILILLLGIFTFAMYHTGVEFNQRQAEIALNRKIKLDQTQIDAEIKQGRIVIAKVGADWCLTCLFNDLTVFNTNGIEAAIKYHNIKLIDVDWTNYDQDVLQFMKKFGRSGLPFYVLFSRNIPDGMVLPELLTEEDLLRLIKGLV